MTIRYNKTRRRKPLKRRSLLVKDHLVIASLAKSKNLGPSALAFHCGHESHSYMSRLLRGAPQARRVTPETAKHLADVLGVPIDALFEVEEVKSLDSTKPYLPRPRRAA